MKATIFIPLVALSVSAWSQTLTVEQALAVARKNRPAVQSALKMVESAKANRQALSAYPGLNFGLGQSSRQGLGATDQDLYLSHSIDIFGRTSALRSIGEAGLTVALAEARTTLLDVQQEVLIAYFEAIATKQHFKVSAELLQVAESLLVATTKRFEIGNVPEIQVTRARIERDRARQAMLLRQAQFAGTQKRLAGAMGIAEVTELPESASLSEPKVDLSQHPELQALDAQAGVALAETRLASKENAPELDITALRTPWREGKSQFGARLQLTWRIYDFGKSRNEAKASRRRAEAFQKLRDDAQKLAAAEIRRLDDELAAWRGSVQSYQAIQQSASELVQKSQSGFAQGYGTLLDVLEATRALREIEQELIEAELAMNLALTAKYKASGAVIEVQD